MTARETLARMVSALMGWSDPAEIHTAGHRPRSYESGARWWASDGSRGGGSVWAQKRGWTMADAVKDGISLHGYVIGGVLSGEEIVPARIPLRAVFAADMRGAS